MAPLRQVYQIIPLRASKGVSALTPCMTTSGRIPNPVYQALAVVGQLVINNASSGLVKNLTKITTPFHQLL